MIDYKKCLNKLILEIKDVLELNNSDPYFIKTDIKEIINNLEDDFFKEEIANEFYNEIMCIEKEEHIRMWFNFDSDADFVRGILESEMLRRKHLDFIMKYITNIYKVISILKIIISKHIEELSINNSVETEKNFENDLKDIEIVLNSSRSDEDTD